MRKHHVITPEQVELEYQLVEMPTRVAASFYDLLLQSAILIILGFIHLAILTYAKAFYMVYYGWLIAISILIILLVYYGFGVYFEFYKHGQTPGKKMFGIKVMRFSGEPASMSHVAIRNAFKFFLDILGIGVWMMLFQKQCRRLGDLVGGTVVVYTTQDNLEIPKLRDRLLVDMGKTYDEQTMIVLENYLERRSKVRELKDLELLDESIKVLLSQQNKDELSLESHLTILKK